MLSFLYGPTLTSIQDRKSTRLNSSHPSLTPLILSSFHHGQSAGPRSGRPGRMWPWGNDLPSGSSPQLKHLRRLRRPRILGSLLLVLWSCCYSEGNRPRATGFGRRSVWMWQLDHRECWALKNWCSQTVVLKKTLESPWDSKEIKPVNPKRNKPWIFIRRTDANAKAPILWPPDSKSGLTGKDPDAGKDWRQEEKEVTVDEMVRWQHWLDGHEFEHALGVGDVKGSLACCSPWGRKELDTTEQLNWTHLSSTEPVVDCEHSSKTYSSMSWISTVFMEFFLITARISLMIQSLPGGGNKHGGKLIVCNERIK